MKMAIIGGGIMGVTIAHFLAKEGVQVDVFEAGSVLGGLAGPLVLEDGTSVDRFYHAILASDSHIGQLCAELGISDQLRFRETRMGFYLKGDIFPMNGIIDFMRFPPLSWIDRFRLGLTILAAQRISDWRDLESINVEEWLVRWGGANAYTNLWRPLLKAKFDGDFRRIPATWVWSRLVRMKSTRQGAGQKEQAGHIVGGYITLVQAMARAVEATGGHFYMRTPVQEIVVEGETATGIRVGGEVRSYDAVVATAQTPVVSRLIPAAPQSYTATLSRQEYLDIICPLLVLDRPLTGYWTLNIADDDFPFTGVIETTTYIDPKYVGGHHLVYLPKYTAPGSGWQSLTDDEIRSTWMSELKRMLPAFSPESVRYFIVNRGRQVEPLHYVGGDARPLPVDTPVRRLYLSTTAQIYPDLSNGEAVTRHARHAANSVLAGLAGAGVPHADRIAAASA